MFYYYRLLDKIHHGDKVLRGSVVMCLTRNPGVLGSSRTGSAVFFVRVSLGETLQSPNLILVKARKEMNNVTDIQLKVR